MSAEDADAGSRRGLFAATAAAAGAVLLGGCGSTSTAQTTTPLTAAQESDIAGLAKALALEQYLWFAYAATTPVLRGRAHIAAKRFLGQELAHINELDGLIRQAGGKPRTPRASYNLGHPRGTRAILELLHSAEMAVTAVYLELVTTLSKPSSRQAISAILANDAQHISVLRIELGIAPVPFAFMSGAE